MYDLVTLLAVLRVQKLPKTFWLSNFYNRQINFTTEKIAFDQVNEDYRRLAPFVAPNVAGKIIGSKGSSLLEFKPAYVKPKHAIKPNDVAFVRRPGEAIGAGSLTPVQRRDAQIAQILEQHRAMHTMRQEWMAANAIINGTVDVEGDGYPKVTVDFKRDASLTEVLSGGALWSATSTATPLTDIYDMRRTSNALCGAVIRDLVFGSEAWNAFTKFPEVEKLLDNMARGSASDFTRLNDGFADTTEFLGTLVGVNGAGLTRLWLDSTQYVDDAGVTQFMLDQKCVVGVDSAMVEGHRCFGAILDHDSLQALEMFPKMYRQDDPSVEYVLTQSAPLMVPKQPNATFKLKVLA